LIGRRNAGKDGLTATDNLELLFDGNPSGCFCKKGGMGRPGPKGPQLRRQMARGKPAWRLESGIATFRRIVSARRGLARDDVRALSAVVPGRAGLLSTPANRRPIKGDKRTETAIQPPNSIANDIALFPRSPAMAGS